jgi:hypothetical protein
MPLGGDPLPQETIDAIRQWITDGATATTAAVSKATMATLRLLSPDPEAETAPADFPPVRELLVSSNRALDAALLGAGVVTLEASGGDGSFDDGNETQVAFRIVLTQQDPNPTVMRIVPAAPLAADRFRLRVSGTPPLALADLKARSIDGDADGTPGGDFIAEFSAGPQR